MSTDRPRHGFTLIEVLIVVVIMAILAATIIPQVGSSTEDAKDSSLELNLHSMRSQIQMYGLSHGGEYPAIKANALPQLTGSTNTAGELGQAGDSYPLGPYITHELPPNAHDGSNKVTAVANPGKKPTRTVGSLGGWQYDESTGGIWPNHAKYYLGEIASPPAVSPSP